MTILFRDNDQRIQLFETCKLLGDKAMFQVALLRIAHMRVYVCARARSCTCLNLLGVVSFNRCTKRKVQTTANVQTYVRRKHCMRESYNPHIYVLYGGLYQYTIWDSFRENCPTVKML